MIWIQLQFSAQEMLQGPQFQQPESPRLNCLNKLQNPGQLQAMAILLWLLDKKLVSTHPKFSLKIDPSIHIHIIYKRLRVRKKAKL